MSQRKLYFLAILIMSLIAGCAMPASSSSTPLPTPTNTVLQDDYAIYTTVLPAPPGSIGIYVIEQTTFTYAGDLTLPDGVIPALDPQTLSGFITQNRQSVSLQTVFTSEDPRYILTNRADFYEKPSPENGLSCTWMRVECFNEPKFRAAYPQASGIFLLSRIGYNADRTQALVTLEQDSGQDSGVTDVLLLSKEAGQWQIVGRYAIHWIV